MTRPYHKPSQAQRGTRGCLRLFPLIFLSMVMFVALHGMLVAFPTNHPPEERLVSNSAVVFAKKIQIATGNIATVSSFYFDLCVKYESPKYFAFFQFCPSKCMGAHFLGTKFWPLRRALFRMGTKLFKMDHISAENI